MISTKEKPSLRGEVILDRSAACKKGFYRCLNRLNSPRPNIKILITHEGADEFGLYKKRALLSNGAATLKINEEKLKPYRDLAARLMNGTSKSRDASDAIDCLNGKVANKSRKECSRLKKIINRYKRQSGAYKIEDEGKRRECLENGIKKNGLPSKVDIGTLARAIYIAEKNYEESVNNGKNKECIKIATRDKHLVYGVGNFLRERPNFRGFIKTIPRL